MTAKLTPVHEFDWPGASGHMFVLTCKNHPTARYLTKNPFTRGLHFTQAPDGFGYAEECPCEFTDLVVVESEE